MSRQLGGPNRIGLGIDRDDAEFEDLGVRVVGEARGLEIYHRKGTVGGGELRQHLRVEAELRRSRRRDLMGVHLERPSDRMAWSRDEACRVSPRGNVDLNVDSALVFSILADHHVHQGGFARGRRAIERRS